MDRCESRGMRAAAAAAAAGEERPAADYILIDRSLSFTAV